MTRLFMVLSLWPDLVMEGVKDSDFQPFNKGEKYFIALIYFFPFYHICTVYDQIRLAYLCFS